MNGLTSEIKQVDLNDDVFIKLNNHSKKEKKIPIKKSYLLKKNTLFEKKLLFKNNRYRLHHGDKCKMCGVTKNCYLRIGDSCLDCKRIVKDTIINDMITSEFGSLIDVVFYSFFNEKSLLTKKTMRLGHDIHKVQARAGGDNAYLPTSDESEMFIEKNIGNYKSVGEWIINEGYSGSEERWEEVMRALKMGKYDTVPKKYINNEEYIIDARREIKLFKEKKPLSIDYPLFNKK